MQHRNRTIVAALVIPQVTNASQQATQTSVRRQLQIVEGRYLRLDRTQNGADGTLGDESADSKSADSGRRDREIAFLARVEFT